MSSRDAPETAVSHPSPQRERVSSPRLLLALILAPTAWLGQLIASYSLSSVACDPSGSSVDMEVVPGLWTLLLLINLASLAAGTVGIWLAWAAWRRSRREKAGGRHTLLDVGEGRTRFMAVSALIVSGIFLVAIAAEAAALLILQRCAPGTWL
ncbi:hypothetical protein E2493_14250 [Sphingomonas parva]|uniref:Uncharacterized protein n=1 Tax=Sphingomonas parva TaxID=2555898 RepID=A0A4Y8ZNE0_9SPHN|nr:hypothetical protein [Sphingomonas parva]TFI57530.1 hypothetical protein E2493_14250 [Sphingomonas parva]